MRLEEGYNYKVTWQNGDISHFKFLGGNPLECRLKGDSGNILFSSLFNKPFKEIEKEEDVKDLYN